MALDEKKIIDKESNNVLFIFFLCFRYGNYILFLLINHCQLVYMLISVSIYCEISFHRKVL
ncbi:hypothetical protein AL542_18540 [Grimontia hollisae]|nr:hypothetical protein AL542_18540 [Grimontia hollisae]